MHHDARTHAFTPPSASNFFQHSQYVELKVNKMQNNQTNKQTNERIREKQSLERMERNKHNFALNAKSFSLLPVFPWFPPSPAMP